MNNEDAIRTRFLAAKPHSTERQLRILAAAEANAIGYGGIAAVARATGMAPSTIGRGLDDLNNPDGLTGSVRRPGAGRPSVTDEQPELLEDLRALLEPETMGDPERLLLWVSKSHAKLALALRQTGHRISANTVGKLLGTLNYRRQTNKKTREGSNHPDRNAQFEHINAQAIAFTEAEQPVVSVDTKKKEAVGDFKNAGTDYRPAGKPDEVRTHDFVDKELGKVAPYGVYDISANAGWVSVGIDHDTAEFAVNALRGWWRNVGHEKYPNAKRLMITADCGGSNGSRVRLWKRELQLFCDETGLSVSVCHYPPGTSKWNKIEHRLFSFITQNWRGKPLTSRLAIVELIGSRESPEL